MRLIMDSFLSNTFKTYLETFQVYYEQNYQEFGTKVMRISFEEMDHSQLEFCLISWKLEATSYFLLWYFYII